MPHKRPSGQRKFQCDFCPTRNSWVRVIRVRDSKHLLCPECIAELARQCKIEKEKMDAASFEKRLQQSNPDAGANSTGRIGHHSLQTETPENAS